MVNLYAKYENPENGTNYDKEKVKDVFVLNQFYKVDIVCMGQSHTSISFIGINGSFNSVMFGFYELIDDKFLKYDIFADADYNPYLKRTTYKFTDIKGYDRTFNVGDLVIQTDGMLGQIVAICNCENCKKRGFYEPRVEYFDANKTSEYMTNYDYLNNFKYYYQIGKEFFGEKPHKEEVLYYVKDIDNKLSMLQTCKQQYNKIIKKFYKEE